MFVWGGGVSINRAIANSKGKGVPQQAEVSQGVPGS